MKKSEMKVKVEKIDYRGIRGDEMLRELYEATIYKFNGVCWNKIESHLYDTKAVAKYCGQLIAKQYLDKMNGKYKYHFKNN